MNHILHLLCCALALLLVAVQSTKWGQVTEITDTWFEDYSNDPVNMTTGWFLWAGSDPATSQWALTSGDSGTYIRFTNTGGTNADKHQWMARYFKCAEESKVSFATQVASCSAHASGDHFRMYDVAVNGTAASSANDYQTSFNVDMSSSLTMSDDGTMVDYYTGSAWSEQTTQSCDSWSNYWLQNFTYTNLSVKDGASTLDWVQAGQVFEVLIKFKITSDDDFVHLWNTRITCNAKLTPTDMPTTSPSLVPTKPPTTADPTKSPTTHEPTTASPTDNPSVSPTDVPSVSPTDVPTKGPTDVPTKGPTDVPTKGPTDVPTKGPTDVPTKGPTDNPSVSPTKEPTTSPTMPTSAPTAGPTRATTASPTDDTAAPTEVPSVSPTDVPSVSPTDVPSVSPTKAPTDMPSVSPTDMPTESPTADTAAPTKGPTGSPTTAMPSVSPTKAPTNVPSAGPTNMPSAAPTPTTSPTPAPTPSAQGAGTSGGSSGFDEVDWRSLALGAILASLFICCLFWILIFIFWKKRNESSVDETEMATTAGA